MGIPFNKTVVNGKELEYINQAITNNHLSGDGPFTKKCNNWLEVQTGCRKALLTHSGTAGLELAAILADIRPGDEVIMPSYTFVSTANAFVLRGGIPVFVDIRGDTLNIDESKIEPAITERTRAIVPIHYAGVACEMDTIMEIARKYNLLVIEDAAQGIMAGYKGRPLGSIGHMAALSFHETKNIISGEGGALLINDPAFMERAEVIREKGTNRSSFYRGEIDKYTWVDIGSSYLPSEITAAFLWAQFEQAESLTAKRMKVWRRYNENFSGLELELVARRPLVPRWSQHNAHIYYLLLPDSTARDGLIKHLRGLGIGASFHYVPLHSSPAGRRFGRISGDMITTLKVSESLVRLPLWPALDDDSVDFIIKEVISFVS